MFRSSDCVQPLCQTAYSKKVCMKKINLILFTVLCAIFLGACSRPPGCDDKVTTDLVKQKILNFYVSRMGSDRASNIVLTVHDMEQLGKSDESGNYRCSAVVDFRNIANNYTASSPIRFETRLSDKDGKPDVSPFIFKFD